jgi:limonene-1,2-epoxide hydrolase
MGAQAEHTIIEFLSLFDTDKPDFPRMMSYIAEGARYRARVTHAEPIVGREAIEKELRRQFSRYASSSIKILDYASNVSQVFTERHDGTVMSDGRKIDALICGIFDLDAAGKITYWREYWDLADLQGQLAPPHA